MTDYRAELSRIEQEIARLEDSALIEPIDPEKATTFAYRLYQRAALTGIPEDERFAEATISEALRCVPNGDLWLLKANCDFKMHRIVQTGSDLEAFPGLRESVEGRALTADIAFQRGQYDSAARDYEAIARDARTWGNLARLAFFKAKMGSVDEADKLYVEAEDELTAKEMRSYAWLELQRGKLAFEYGRFSFAEVHFKRAGRAYSGYWLVERHVADLLRAQGRLADAATVYSTVVATTHRPEHRQALGDLYVSLGKSGEAKSQYDAALTAFLESADRGDVHYYHHLADYYIESRPDKAKALEWAQKDVAIRRNYLTLTVLAWALYSAGRVDEALVASDEALSTRIVDAEMLYQAAAINFAASRPAESDRLLQFAKSINPHMRTNYPTALFDGSDHRQPVS